MIHSYDMSRKNKFIDKKWRFSDAGDYSKPAREFCGGDGSDLKPDYDDDL